MRCRAAGEDFPAPNGGVDVFGIEFEGKGFASGSFGGNQRGAATGKGIK